MQKFLAKYALAAHLALLAVAPLLLFPYCGEVMAAGVVLWLVFYAACWTVLAPSVRRGEHLHDAQRRSLGAMVRDPLFWVLLALVVLAGVRAFNTGIGLAYDAEQSHWHVSPAAFAVLPGSVGASGVLPFAAALAVFVLLMACRHSLGRSARMAFLFVSSLLTGLAAGAALLRAYFGAVGAADVMIPGDSSCTCAGVAFGIYFLVALVVLLTAFERKWNAAMIPVMIAIGGNAAGMFAFSPPFISAATALVGIALLAFSFVFACLTMKSAPAFKLLIVAGLSLVAGGLLVAALLPPESLDVRLKAFREFVFLPADFWAHRGIGQVVAVKTWLSHLWIGTGVASFPLDFRFCATSEAWQAFPRGASWIASGWCLFLAERGIVGLVSFALPVAFLVWTWAVRLIGGLSQRAMPHPTCLLAPMLIVAVVVSGFFDCSFMRAEVLMSVCAVSAISTGAFRRKVENGR